MRESIGGGVVIARRGLRGVVLVLVCSALVGASSADAPLSGPLRAGALLARTSPSPPSTKASRGKFLVAKRSMQDPRFSRSVILLVEHGENGTMGLVINHRTDLTLSEALPQFVEKDDRSEFLFMGGPLQQATLTVLFQSRSQDEGARPVLEGVFFTANASLLERILGKERKKTRHRAFGGHAGWAPGQLAHELKRDDWYVLQAEADDLFHEPSSEIWLKLVKRAEARWVQLAPVPRSRPHVIARPEASCVARAERILCEARYPTACHCEERSDEAIPPRNATLVNLVLLDNRYLP